MALCGGLASKLWADGARPVPVTPQHAARCDGHGRQQLVQLIVVADGKGDVARLEGSALIRLVPAREKQGQTHCGYKALP